MNTAPLIKPFGLYLHVPFCVTTCDFCGFYQEKPRKNDILKYVEGIEQEIELIDLKSPINSIFWGGGTPGVLPLNALQKLGRMMRGVARHSYVEWTVELAPSTVNPRKLNMLKSLGVTRISLGVQSFDDDVLERLGRAHSVEQIERAYYMVRNAGFENVNLDMMFAMPGQEVEQWHDDLMKAVKLEPEHISTYCLTFEEDTALWVKLKQGKYKLDVETDRELYLTASSILQANGYTQYEISNYAKPEKECVHNINTWRMQEWVGLGPSAASQHNGMRYANVPSLTDWLGGLKRRELFKIDEVALDHDMLATDSIIFGLRMTSGIDLDEIKKRFPSWHMNDEINRLIRRLDKGAYITCDENRIALTMEGRLVADAIGVEFMDAIEGR